MFLEGENLRFSLLDYNVLKLFQILTFFRIDPANMTAQYLIEVLKSNLNKTAIKQFQVAVPLRMNTAKGVT